MTTAVDDAMASVTPSVPLASALRVFRMSSLYCVTPSMLRSASSHILDMIFTAAAGYLLSQLSPRSTAVSASTPISLRAKAPTQVPCF